MKTKLPPYSLDAATFNRWQESGIDMSNPQAVAVHALVTRHLDPVSLKAIAAAVRSAPRQPDPMLAAFRNALQ